MTKPTDSEIFVARFTWYALAFAYIVTTVKWAEAPGDRWCDCFGLVGALFLLMALGESTKERGCWR